MNGTGQDTLSTTIRASRFATNPLITIESHPSLGDNVDGPSVIAVPDWVEGRLGRYYLYFAHHKGRSLRLAYADDLQGPWRVHEPGVLPLADSTCLDHVASPDVHIEESQREIRLYFHGEAFPKGQPTDGLEQRFGAASRWIGNQRTKLAVSRDGLNFTARSEPLMPSYARIFKWQGVTYALAMPGVFYRSTDGVTNFEMGPVVFGPEFRHCAVLRRGHVLHIFYTRAGDCPEHILHTTVDLRPDWQFWVPHATASLLLPELAYEGGDVALEPSARGPVYRRVRQLRDPAVFVDADDRCALFYAIAGEHGIAGAWLQGLERG